MPERPRYIDSYTNQLGIQWPVSIEPGNVNGPSIITSPAERRHYIQYPVGGSLPECDALHELVHASWAEKLDPLFCSIFYERAIDTEDYDTRVRMYHLYYAQQLIDVWVGDRMWQVNPETVKQDIGSYAMSMAVLPESALRAHQPGDIYVSLAIQMASIERHKVTGYNNKMKGIVDKIKKIYGVQAERMINRLTRLFKELPELPSERETALAVFQEQTQRAARIMGLDFTPVIVEEDGTTCWQMQPITS